MHAQRWPSAGIPTHATPGAPAAAAEGLLDSENPYPPAQDETSTTSRIDPEQAWQQALDYQPSMITTQKLEELGEPFVGCRREAKYE